MQTTIRLLLVVLCSFLSRQAWAGPCAYRLYPDQFDTSQYTLPNSVCIFPDGRTSLTSASLGGLALQIDLLQKINWSDGQYYNYNWPMHGMLLGDASTNLILCGQQDAYLVHSASAFAFPSVPIYGGGHSGVDQSGQPIASAVVHWAPDDCGVHSIAVAFNSPDITGDLIVDLSDTVLFSSDISNVYNYRSDFNYDGVVNMSDLVIYCSGLGAACP